MPNIDDIDHVVFCGMGGSGIVGDVVTTVGSGVAAGAERRAQAVPHARVRRPRTLVFAVSYSGNTEETLSMAEGALDAGAHLVTISSGGALEELGSDARPRAPPVQRRDSRAAPGARRDGRARCW